jgi:hypothetical protein
MPFHPPFKAQFEVDDLVYGLHEQRDEYALNFAYFKQSKTPQNISTIDQYAATHLELNNQLSHNIPNDQKDFLQSLASHSKYHQIVTAEGFSINKKILHHHNVIARKCKAGLFWVSHSNSQKTIHFILDGVNMDQVVGKSHERDQHEKSYTGVELRWIYRNRHDVNVQKRIQFWLDGRPSPPPWEGNGAILWQRYVPHSA